MRMVVEDGPVRIKELMSLGVNFSGRSGEGKGLDLGREGGHSRNRIVHARDLTGREVEQSLLAALKSHPNISVYEQHFAIDLITEHHLYLNRGSNPGSIHCDAFLT